jgi:hypothetical protein
MCYFYFRNLSYNNFTGHVPSAKNFSKFPMERYKQMALSVVFDIPYWIIVSHRNPYLNAASRVIQCSMCTAKIPAVDILMVQKVPNKSCAAMVCLCLSSNSTFYITFTLVNISRTAVACIILGFIILLCIMLLAIYKTNQPQPPVKGSDKPVQGLCICQSPLE